jgi:hypothetical protein
MGISHPLEREPLLEELHARPDYTAYGGDFAPFHRLVNAS